MADPTDMLYAARVHTSRIVADAIDAWLDECGDDAASIWYDADTDVATVTWFCATQAEADQRLARLEEAARQQAIPGTWRGEVCPTLREDWAESWKRFFHAERVSDRVWVCPSWEPVTPAPDEVVVSIDPGMSFGTGQHATTRGCIVCLDRIARKAGAPLRFIDAGCGSGILAIAAAKLGYGPIVAFDNDPLAVTIARENAEQNHAADRIVFHTADLGAIPAWGPADVIAANILAPVLIAHVTPLAQTLCSDPSARLILSGILREQSDDVVAALLPASFEVEERIDVGEWTTLCMRRA